MIRTAENRNSLSKRIKRFIEREQTRDQHLADLLGHMKSLEHTYLFGGVVRDIALDGIAKFGSDIDLVYTTSMTKSDLTRIGGLSVNTNRFGGFRIRTKCWLVDMWEAERSWAFMHGYREYTSIESLLDTTITNWESILYRLDGGGLICNDHYFDDLQKRYLDIVFEKNPNTLGMYIRLVRAYAIKDASILSNKAAHVIRDGLCTYSFEEMRDYESNHYPDAYISEEIYNYLKNHKGIRNPRESLVQLERRQRTLPFDKVPIRETI